MNNGHGEDVGLKEVDALWFMGPYIWHGLHFLMKSSQSFHRFGQNTPYLMTFRAKFFPAMCSPQIPEWISFMETFASSSLMQRSKGSLRARL